MKDKPSLEEIAKAIPEATSLEEIGSGGYKVVCKAKVDDKFEAIKLVLIPCDMKDESVREENLRRITREIDILRKCTTPYLVKLGSISPRECRIGSDEYVLYSEEYLPGQSLRELVLKEYRPNIQELAELALCILKAIQELAPMGIIHRDIKPDNIIKTGHATRPFVLLDLGIAFHIGGTPITRDTAQIPGTRYYIAPEMLDLGFRQNLDYRADLYTIGLTLYEFASGINPFAYPDDPQWTTLYRIKTHIPKSLYTLRDDLPKDFCGLIDQLMRKIPALRPANLEMLVRKMEALK